MGAEAGPEEAQRRRCCFMMFGQCTVEAVVDFLVRASQAVPGLDVHKAERSRRPHPSRVLEEDVGVLDAVDPLGLDQHFRHGQDPHSTCEVLSRIWNVVDEACRSVQEEVTRVAVGCRAKQLEHVLDVHGHLLRLTAPALHIAVADTWLLDRHLDAMNRRQGLDAVPPIRADDVSDAEGRCSGANDRTLMRRGRVARDRVALRHGATATRGSAADWAVCQRAV